MQITDTILMVRPAAFAFNEETAATNHFQQKPLSTNDLQQKAAAQFDAMVETLRTNGIKVIVIDDTPQPPKPDAIFPNNWMSTNADGVLSIFPMQAVSRRAEKRKDIIDFLSAEFKVSKVEDWGHSEKENRFLEGTGSMVMDHEHKIIYACLSPRTNKQLLGKFATAHGYRVVGFYAHDKNGKEIYHTNVMMCVGEGFAVVCINAIINDNEKEVVVESLEATGHSIIPITHEQMNAFAGNMLQVKSENGDRLIVLSKTSFASLKTQQIKKLQCHGKLLPMDVSIIEQVEGGSVRCMMAEVFLPRK